MLKGLMKPFVMRLYDDGSVYYTCYSHLQVALIYQSELAIEGTIGVTVDKRQVIMVHFSEQVESQPSVDSSQSAGLLGTEVGVAFPLVSPMKVSSTSSAIKSQKMNLKPGADPVMSQASSRFHQLPSWKGTSLPKVHSPTSTNKGFGDSDSEFMGKNRLLSMPVAGTIDLDTDSETFSSLGFEDDVEGPSNSRFSAVVSSVGEDPDNCSIFLEKKEPESTMYEEECVLSSDCDMKDIIVIEDQDLMEETVLEAQAREFGSPQDTEAESKLNAGLVDTKSFLSDPPPPPVTKEEDSLSGVTETVASVLMQFSQAGQLIAPTDSGHSSVQYFDCPSGSKFYHHHPCKICGKMLPSVTTLESHLVENHGITTIEGCGDIPHRTCPHCKKKFRFQATLDKHAILHVSEKPHKCNICGNAYMYAESLQIHQTSHSNDYCCQPCHKVYSSKQLFQKHIVYMHEMRRTSKKVTLPSKPYTDTS